MNARRQISELDIERHALWAGLFCALLGLVTALIIFAGERPALFGGLSVGLVSAATGGVGAAVSSAHGFRALLRAREPWLRRIPRWRQYLTAAGLVIVHAASAVMTIMVVFNVVQRAFFGLHLDVLAAALMTAAACGLGAYLSLVSTARTTAESLSVVLGIYMTAGVLISMLLAEDQIWWQSMFSQLGTVESGTGSFITFNSTMIISGLVLMAFSEFLTRDLVVLARLYRPRSTVTRLRLSRVVRPRPRIVRWCLIAAAIGVIGLASIPVNVAGGLHSGFVQLASAAMIVLLVGTPVLLPGYPVVFHMMSWSAVGAIWAAFLLWDSWGYYNLTGFELSAVAILFLWISVFIRTTAAMIRDRPASGISAAHTGRSGPQPRLSEQKPRGENPSKG